MKFTSVQLHSMTHRCAGIERELVSQVQIGFSFTPNDSIVTPFPGTYTAVWDTGATSSVITQHLADALQLEQAGTCLSGGAYGDTVECRTFLISLFLPNTVVIPELEVSDCDGDIGGDMLIGMDVITMGDFAVSNFGGHTTFTFRMPSVQEIDFVTQKPNQYQASNPGIPSRNAPCPCGSGKNYKSCCGKNV